MSIFALFTNDFFILKKIIIGCITKKYSFLKWDTKGVDNTIGEREKSEKKSSGSQNTT